MRGDPTLFTRNDEVEAQWRICDPIVTHVGADARTAAAVRRRLAGAGGGRASCCARATPGGRSEMATATPRRRLERAGHDARRDRSGAARAAERAPRARGRARAYGLVPARVLNMIVFVDRDWSGEIANRLRGVGRYHASRTGRALLRARARAARRARDGRLRRRARNPGELALLRETVVVEIGERHLDDLLTIADPLVVTDLPTLLWSPHGHPEAVDALLALAQAVLLDSIDEPVWREALDRACALTEQAYVVDLAWLRSTPWRERVAATFDPAAMRPELRTLRAPVTVRHHPDSTVAAMLLVGWLASRLGWQLERARIESRPARRRPDGSARTRRPPGRRRCACRPRPSCRYRAWRASRCADRLGAAARARSRTRRPARAPPRPRAAASASGRSSAPRAARAGSSARASARRCCATRPTCRRCAPRGRCCPTTARRA